VPQGINIKRLGIEFDTLNRFLAVTPAQQRDDLLLTLEILSIETNQRDDNLIIARKALDLSVYK
jgi:hypothetical protein